MNVTITNHTGDRYLLQVGGLVYPLDSRAHQQLRLSVPDETHFFLVNQEKNYVHISLLDIAFGLFFGNSTQTQLCCDYAFAVKKMDSDDVHVAIEPNHYIPVGEHYIFSAAYVRSPNALVADLGYTMPQRERIRKKHFCKHFFITSLWPVAVLLIALCFILSSEWMMLLLPLLAAWLIGFGGPAVYAVSGFHNMTNPAVIDETLKKRAYEERARIGSPEAARDRRVDNLLDKVLVNSNDYP